DRTLNAPSGIGDDLFAVRVLCDVESAGTIDSDTVRGTQTCDRQLGHYTGFGDAEDAVRVISRDVKGAGFADGRLVQIVRAAEYGVGDPPRLHQCERGLPDTSNEQGGQDACSVHQQHGVFASAGILRLEGDRDG